jgi:hypothetical protein
MTRMTRIRVECYSGYKGSERPLRFFIGDREHSVERIDGQWREPDGSYFRVLASDGKRYLLHHLSGDDWRLVEGSEQAGGAGPT